MKNYLEFFEPGGEMGKLLPKEYTVRLNNDENKAGFVPNGEFIVYNKAKEGIKTLIENIREYVNNQKALSNLYTPTSRFTNPAPSIGISIATKGKLYNPIKVS